MTHSSTNGISSLRHRQNASAYGATPHSQYIQSRRTRLNVSFYSSTKLIMGLLMVFMVVALPLGVNGACQRPGSNRRSPADVLPTFDALVSEKYIGQDSAVQAVRRELVEYFVASEAERAGGDRRDSPLVLHFIGPSGTGKSYLAELVAKSIFEPSDCTPQNLGTKAKIGTAVSTGLALAAFAANPILAAGVGAMAGWAFGSAGELALEKSCTNGKPLLNWTAMCGLYRRAFVPFTADEQLHNVMETVLGDVAVELMHNPHSVIIFDDFQFCAARACEHMLKEPLTTHTLYTPIKNTPISLRDAIVIMTSDLSTFGVQLEPGITAKEARVQVSEAAEAHWGTQSFILSVPQVIAFAPLSHKELVRIVHKIVERFKEKVVRRVQVATRELGRRTGKTAQWLGSFYCSENTMEIMVDRLHEQVEAKNARALTIDLNNMLKKIAHKPQPIEQRVATHGQRATLGGGSKEKGRGQLDASGTFGYRASVELVVDYDYEVNDPDAGWLRLDVID